MSLIQDALKRKREEEVAAPPQEAPAAPPAIEPKPVKPNPTPDKLLIALILLIVISLISMGIVTFLRSTPSASTQQIAPVVKAPDVIVEKSAPVVDPEPEAKDKWPKLELTGFASGGGQRMVFINGKMLTEGREIDGARIVQIGKTEVLVEYQGERRILRADE